MENLRSLEPQAKISHSYKKKKSVFSVLEFCHFFKEGGGLGEGEPKLA